MKLFTGTIDTRPPTPQELAEYWWNRDSAFQAEFFNWLGRPSVISLLPSQLHYLVKGPVLHPEGLATMRMIGEYAAKEDIL